METNYTPKGTGYSFTMGQARGEITQSPENPNFFSVEVANPGSGLGAVIHRKIRMDNGPEAALEEIATYTVMSKLGEPMAQLFEQRDFEESLFAFLQKLAQEAQASAPKGKLPGPSLGVAMV